jgi:heme A synthase
VLGALRVGLTLFATLFGLLLALYTAYAGNREGRAVKRNLSLACAGVCIVLLANPVAQIDLLSRLGLA